MVLYSYSFGKVIIGILIVTLSLLVLAIAYKKLLAYLGKGTPSKEDYCVLYGMESQPNFGEVQIYFEMKLNRFVSIQLWNNQLEYLTTIKEGEFTSGGNIVTFDTKQFENGHYFYTLITDNQKTMKKIEIKNI